MEMSETIKLTKSEGILYDGWANDYRNLMAQFAALVNDNMTMRIADLAREHGLDPFNDEWSFNHKEKAFEKVDVAEVVEEEKQEPTMMIPGKEKAQ
ncbi:MAG: hypothetical protein MZV63_15495 [Marinilabiliales bacterium]|nr:hypothetical protein [Marinilabiliales bacterium]